MWTSQTSSDQISVDGDAAIVGAVVSVYVRVLVEVLARAPEGDSGDFDYVAEVSLECRSGRLVIMGCTDFEPEASRFEVPSGMLRLRVSKSNLDAAVTAGVESDESLMTMEYVRIQVWPSSADVLVVMKRWQENYAIDGDA